MNSGEQILSIFAITILTLLILSVYNSYANKDTAFYNNEAIITGTGEAQSMLNEIKSRAFDQNTVNKAVSSPDSLTPTANLGPDLGESVSTQFNDIDDYNNYTRADTMSRMGIFNIKVNVYYIANMSNGVKSTVPTYSKEVDIFVTNFSLPDTLKFNQVITY